MKKYKKLLSVILALCVLLTTFMCIPVVANADENIETSSFVENEILITATESNGTSTAQLNSAVLNCVTSNIQGDIDYDVIIEDSMAYADDKRLFTVSLKDQTMGTSADIWEICETINAGDSGLIAQPNFLYDINTDEDIEYDLSEVITDISNVQYTGENNQWYFKDSQTIEAWDAYEKHGEGVLVAVIDTGCDYFHEDLSDSVVSFVEGGTEHRGLNVCTPAYLYDITDYDGHGTAVSSVIAAQNNGSGVKGVAYNAQILPVKVSDYGYDIPETMLVKAIERIKIFNEETAQNEYNSLPKVSVVNLSLSGNVESYKFHSNSQIIAGLKLAVDDLSESCIVVAAAGNKTSNTETEIGVPAGFDSVIGVMSYASDGKLSWFSNYDPIGSYYNLAAPGSSIYTANANWYIRPYKNECDYNDGTSLASPYVAGAIALYISNYPNASLERVKADLFKSLHEKVNSYNSSEKQYSKLSVLDYLNMGLLNDNGQYSGMCGENAFWQYDHNDKSLSITGTGDIDDYLRGESPWYNFRHLISTCSITDNITAIGENSFIDLNCLETLDIGSGIERIGDSAFSYCKIVETVNIPETATEIGDGAFLGCSNLKTLTLPTTISSNSGLCIFQKCISLTSVTIPEGWTEIPTAMFLDCSSLSSISLPFTLQKINPTAFKNCSNLANFVLPENLTEIRSQAFANCTTLTSLVMPRILNEIETKAFSGCSGLQDVTIYDGVTTMQSNIFENCPSVTIIAYINSEPLTYAQNNGIAYEVIYRLNTKENSTTYFNRNENYICGLRGYLTKAIFTNTYVQLDDGYTLSYDMTSARYMGTGTIVQVLKGDVVVETYSIVIFGDVDGSGIINNRDVSYLNGYLNGTTTIPDGSVELIAGDLYEFGSGITQEDVNLMESCIVFSTGINQNPFIET